MTCKDNGIVTCVYDYEVATIVFLAGYFNCL